jgi:hypothetical protein
MKLIVRGALLVVLFAIASVGHAGRRYIYEISVFQGSSFGYGGGSLVDARGSTDSIQSMGCYTNGTSAGCTAVNKDGVAGSCFTVDPIMIDTIESISSESYVYFQWDKSGYCYFVSVTNGSQFKPSALSGY